ncbi:hypothetical protein EXIGLDRAFT_681951 [Exidia glandulosa HHB12029]|uniref:F-box domain-containing protein n=1 Tax=Exidia glandulosa HHB12029 TaxID=1314781 RepID=A0A165DTG1_EXIGL|nr:hypothetical protein EXIGLDRAFT_681951 [Exidia glandulosa HHB12029]
MATLAPTSPALQSLPPELLEQIAVFAFRSHSQTPFADLHALGSCTRLFSRQLHLAHNPLLYSRIFRTTFDCIALRRRMDFDKVPPAVVAQELQKRFQAMWRFRREPTEDDLWAVLLMLFEHDRRNRHLLDIHADIRNAAKRRLDTITRGHPLRKPRGGDDNDEWPAPTRELTLILWILWMTVTDADQRDAERGEMLFFQVLTPYALGGHRYALSRRTWSQFDPGPLHAAIPLDYFGAPLTLRDPEFVPVVAMHYLLRLVSPPDAPIIHAPLGTGGSLAWDGDYARIASQQVLRPGTFSGVWEGGFLFMEFHNYIGLLHGAGPRTLLHSYVGQHAQVWKLREYGLHGVPPVPHGDPLNAFFPSNAVFREVRGTLEVTVPEQSWTYRLVEDGGDSEEVDDVIVMGEGHSSWGRFTLRGRVRPADGLVTLVKQYANRGLWLYRGFVIGGREGHLVGRWRDVESPVEQDGYEGCFVLGRRRE